MAKYGVFDENGRINGFYDTSVNTNIPSEAVLLTQEQYELILSNNDRYIWDYATSTVIESPVYWSNQLTAAKNSRNLTMYSLYNLHNKDSFTANSAEYQITDIGMLAGVIALSILNKNVTDWVIPFAVGNIVTNPVSLVNHSAVEIQNVASAFEELVSSNYTNYVAKVAAVNAITDASEAGVSAVNAISWS